MKPKSWFFGKGNIIGNPLATANADKYTKIGRAAPLTSSDAHNLHRMLAQPLQTHGERTLNTL